MTRTAADKRHYLLRKLHSLTGILPIGGYLLFHLFENSQILLGAEKFQKGVDFIESFQWMIIPVEALLIGSLLFHGLYGLVIAAEARPNVGRYPLARNWFFIFQRVSGVIALLFIGFHVWQTRFHVYMGMYGGWEPVHVSAKWMSENIWGADGNNMLLASAYIIGVVMSVFHLTNGIWSFLIKWGITVGPRAQRVSAYAFTSLGVILSAAGVAIAYGFKNI